MNRDATIQCPLDWNDIEKRVIEPFNLDDVGVSYGVSCWREHMTKTRRLRTARELVHKFSAPAVLEAVVEFFRADIAENIAIFKARLARNARLMRLMNLRVALNEAQGVFPAEDEGEQLAPELLAVIRMTKTAKTTMLKQVVHAAMTVADGDGDERPSWPTGLGDGIQDFANDLTEFISANGDEGREMVKRVRQDTVFARSVGIDDTMPRPIKFLAQVVAEIGEGKQLPDRKSHVGFGVARG